MANVNLLKAIYVAGDPTSLAEVTELDTVIDLVVGELNSGPLAGFRNRIINGGFDIWQRGTSVFNSGSFSADRWYTLSNATIAVSQQMFTLGTAPAAGYAYTYFHRVYRSADGTYVTLQQRIEDVRTYAGQQVTLSFWGKADSAVSIVSGVAQNFGSGGSPSTEVSYQAAVNLTTSWAKHSVTITLASIAGKTLGSNANSHYLVVFPFKVTDALAHTIDVWGVQLEPGSVATPFEFRPYSVEFALCQRYLPSVDLTTYIVGGLCTSATSAWATLAFSVPARVAPGGYTSSVAVNFTMSNGASAGAAPFYSATITNAILYSGSLSGLTTGNSTMLTAASPTKLLFTGCEL